MKQYIKICPVCNTTFSRRKDIYIYCSNQCGYKGYSQKYATPKEIICPHCGKEFLATSKKLFRKYCSRLCADKAHSIEMKKKTDIECAVCGKLLTPKRGTNIYCSRACLSKGRMVSPDINFWPNVLKTETCWLWQGGLNHDGYGVYCTNSKATGAHRFSYILVHGEIPKGLNILHRCDVRNCVNPDHLFLGSQLENVRDMINKGRAAVGEKSGTAKFTADQVTEIRSQYASGRYKIVEIARKHHVSATSISQIVHRKTWVHVA